MGRGLDSAKREAWRRRLREFAGSGESIARFCDREGVSVTSFYRWRRALELRGIDRGTAAARVRTVADGPGARMTFLPVAITSGAITSGAITSGAITSGAITSGAITSGAITSGAITSGAITSGAITPGAASPADESAASDRSLRIEVLLPGGVRLLVPGGDAVLVRTVIAALADVARGAPAC